jgi:glycerol-3-phosphate dehydrogenase (NAD+)
LQYLPGRSLPENIIAEPDIVKATADADLLIFVLPHQFIPRACTPIASKLKPGDLRHLFGAS